MTINVRQKGQEGEREIAKILNAIVAKVRDEFKLSQYATRDELFQRNQNQSAVGGSDLSNPLYLDIEVKRQEDLSVNSWWKQCIEAAERGACVCLPTCLCSLPRRAATHVSAEFVLRSTSKHSRNGSKCITPHGSKATPKRLISCQPRDLCLYS